MDLKQTALAHYERMIDWAKQQNPKEKVDKSKMLDSIGENWGGRHCVYCKQINDLSLSCKECNIYLPDGNDSKVQDCAGGNYANVCDAETWGQWIKSATKMKVFIKVNG
jgi:hypothetical protein